MKHHPLQTSVRSTQHAIVLLWVVLSAHALAQSASITADHDFYIPGDPIVVSFFGGPGAKKDWVGVYPEGVVPGSQGSTLWNYVDNTRGGNTGFTEGQVSFPTGLSFAGKWYAYLLANDGYTILAETSFTIVEPSAPFVHSDKRVYKPGENISITFANGPANPKDWIGIYPEGVVPGTQASTLWFYVDGSGTGAAGQAQGTILFRGGLSKVGNYAAYLLENDGYTQLAGETFKVQVSANDTPRITAIEPANDSVDAPPGPAFSATVTIASLKVAATSVELTLDDVKVPHAMKAEGDKLFITYLADKALPSASKHIFKLSFADSAGGKYSQAVSFTVRAYTEVKLPSPLFLETFDSVGEGKLPTGWTEKSYSEVQNDEIDFNNLDSAAYKTWTVVEASRFLGTFLTYSNVETPAGEANDYQRVLRSSGLSVVNGVAVRQLAKGRMLFSDSGYRRGRSQVMSLETPDYDLSGRQAVYLSFHSLWEQNQDSLAAVEYSVNGGQHWLPVVYHLDSPDVVVGDSGLVDVQATFTQEHGDVARYTDELGNELGGAFGAFVRAPLELISPQHIQTRVNDSPTDGKRVELFRLDKADNQKQVRIRFTHAGTDSWYWGLDDVGLYSIAPEPPVAPQLVAQKSAGGLRIAWVGSATGFVLESADSLVGGAWTPVAGVSEGSSEIQIKEAQLTGSSRYFRLRKP